jgi:hypothetical protein
MGVCGYSGDGRTLALAVWMQISVPVEALLPCRSFPANPGILLATIEHPSVVTTACFFHTAGKVQNNALGSLCPPSLRYVVRNRLTMREVGCIPLTFRRDSRSGNGLLHTALALMVQRRRTQKIVRGLE